MLSSPFPMIERARGTGQSGSDPKGSRSQISVSALPQIFQQLTKARDEREREWQDAVRADLHEIKSLFQDLIFEVQKLDRPRGE